jgi:hypothetical protein
VGLSRVNGFQCPHLYVRDADDRLAQAAATALMVLSVPLVALYMQCQSWWLRRVKEHDEKALVLDGIGAWAYCHTTWDRLRRRRARYGLDEFLAGPGAGRLFVIDDFYADPDAIRALGLVADLTPYEQGWFKTGTAVPGDLHAIKESARQRFEAALGRPVDAAVFHADLTGQAATWNGAFNVKLSENLFALNACSIHNHSDLGSNAWAAVVYLNPHSRPQEGTTFWAQRHQPDVWLVGTRTFDAHVQGFVPIAEVPARYNRAVLFPVAALHRGESGHGSDQASGRMFQTYFFVT